MLTDTIKKIYKSDKFPFLLYIIAIILPTLIMQKTGADDIFYSNVCADGNLFGYLAEVYQTWSSRLVITGSLVIFCGFLPMFVWKIVNIGMYCLLIYSISKLIKVKNQRKMNFILVGSLLCIPLAILAEAGWIATINNYLWVAATGLYAMIPLRKIIDHEKINIFQAISYILAMIYATNQEQMAGILFIVYGCFTVMFIKKNKKIKPILAIMNVITIASLVFILTCPGNATRKAQEELTWYPGYSDLSLVDKLEIGLTSMMDYCVLDERLIFYVFLVVVGLGLFKKAKNNKYKILAFSPLAIEIAFKYSNKFFNDIDWINIMETQLYEMFKVATYIAILALAGICIYFIFKEKDNIQKSLIALLIYFLGIISRYVMAFSPTVYASQERTSLFLYISLCILIVCISNEIDVKKEKGISCK